MQVLFQLIVSGIAVGMIYAVIAFGYQLTFATSKTLNFGQGEALMLGALVGLTSIQFLIGLGLTNYWAYLLMIPIVLRVRLLQGAVVESLGVRQAIKTKSESGWIMATIALGIIFKNVAENIWGRDDLQVPLAAARVADSIPASTCCRWRSWSWSARSLMMLAVEMFNRRSIYGKAVVATSNDRDAAGLMGINTGLVITFSYALSSLTAAFAGVLIAPLTLTGATMGAALGPEGLRGRHHRRPVQRHRRHRRRPHPRHRRDADRLSTLDRLQGRARASCCCCSCWR